VDLAHTTKKKRLSITAVRNNLKQMNLASQIRYCKLWLKNMEDRPAGETNSVSR
jgi:hypothetical protein